MPKQTYDNPEDRIDALERSLKKAVAKVEKIEARLGKAQTAVFDEFMQRADDALSRLQAGLARQYVATEISRCVGHLEADRAAAIRGRVIELFDMDDRWWMSQREREIGQWLTYLETGRWGVPIHPTEWGESCSQ